MSNNAEKPGIGTLTLLSICFRSLFIQASFTLTEKTGVGFAVSLYPGLIKLTKDKVVIQQLLTRHSRYFNTHPYLAPFILGSVLRLEELAKNNPENAIKNIENFKNRFSGVLGSLGDRLFWKYLKPCASSVALIILFSNMNDFPENSIASIVGFLVIFNMFHFFYRLTGLYTGYSYGLGVIKVNSILTIERINAVLSMSMLLLLGLLAALESNLASEGGITGVVIFSMTGLTVFFLNYKKVSPAVGIIVGLCISLALFTILN